MNQPTIVIEEILGRATQGVTKPFICKADDGQTYYVKGIGAGRRSQIAEWVSAQLATHYGLPIAEYALAEVPEALIDPRIRSDIAELGAGVVFASRDLAPVQELSITTRDLVPNETATDILVFDWWIHNEDRHLTEFGGNPNLLWDVSTNEVAVIDHNQAFDRTFNAANFLNSHVFACYWNQVFSDQLVRQHYEDKIQSLLPKLNGIRANIPRSWWFFAPGVPADIAWDEVAACLTRCNLENFWNAP